MEEREEGEENGASESRRNDIIRFCPEGKTQAGANSKSW